MHVLIVDDHLLLAEALAASLRRAGFETSVAGSGAEALGVVECERIDAALVDIDLPDIDGVALGRAIATRRPDVALLALSGTASRSVVRDARAAGFRGYLVKGTRIARIVDALRDAASGRWWPAAASVPGRDPHPLTPREREVLRLLAAGTSSLDIAARLDVRPNTVRSHIRNVLMKLGARNRLEAVATAARLGLVGSRSRPASSVAPEGS